MSDETPANPPDELDARMAVLRAKTYLMEMFQSEAADILLEEIDRPTLSPSWRVTLSFLRPGSKGSNAFALAMNMAPRLYKVIEVDARTGDIRSMRIRELKSDA